MISTSTCLQLFVLLQVAVVVVLSARRARGALYCKDDNGNDVDWVIAYKIPRLADQPAPLNTGYSYAYMTGKPVKGNGKARAPGWKLSTKLVTDPTSLFGQTLAPVYADPKKFTNVLYNDDPPHEEGNTYWAHAKGVLAMDKQTGIWLIHSVPNFVAKFDTKYEYPESGRLNGQTLMCISFDAAKEGNDIAEQLSYMRPNVYSLAITDEVAALAPAIRVLETKKWPVDNQNMHEINSLRGETFLSFSKNTKSEGDLYSQIVAPGLAVDLLVETWRRGAGGPLTSNCTGGPYKVYNIENVNLPLVESPQATTGSWKYISDHAKWAVSTDAEKPFSCIGDINRMASQFRRGGGTVCFKSAPVWNVVSKSVEGVEACAAKAAEAKAAPAVAKKG